MTGSTDSTVRLWQLERKDYTPSMSQTHIMRSHTAPVACVAACRAWSLVVSGSEDGTAIIWDLNRAAYVRSIRHGRREDLPANEIEAVNLVAINESTVCISRFFTTSFFSRGSGTTQVLTRLHISALFYFSSGIHRHLFEE